MSHGDRVEEAAPGFAATATSSHSPFAALRHESKPFVAVQFHPEVAHTLIGTDVLRNFIFDLCGCHPSGPLHSFIDATVREIRAKVGGEQVICALSGGVDSSVTAALVHRAIGDQLTCIYVNNGLMRTGETESVLRFFRQKTHLRVIDIDATLFSRTAAGRGRSRGKTQAHRLWLIEIFEKEARELGAVKYLARAPYIPMSSSPWSSTARPPSSRTITWAACRNGCIST